MEQTIQYLHSIEPNQTKLEADLMQLGVYLVKVGTNVNILRGHYSKRILSLNHRQLNIRNLENLVKKYNLTWSKDCDNLDFGKNGNRSLYHVAQAYPRVFIDVAASVSPGTYDERRFWWCANNLAFWLKYSKHTHQQDQLQKAHYSPSRLVSDVLYKLLTLKEQKLIAICALATSVKYSEAQVFTTWYSRNKLGICKRIEADELGRLNPELKEQLRTRYKIAEAEAELQTIHVDFFIEWWNLTGLRRVYKSDRNSSPMPRQPTSVKTISFI